MGKSLARKIDFLKSKKRNVLIILIIFPLLFFIVNNFSISKITIDKYDFSVLAFTIKQALFSTLLAFLLGILPAVYISKNRNLLSKLLDSTFIIPFYFPSSAAALVFSIMALYIYEKTKIDLFGGVTIIIVAHAFYNSPIIVKYVSGALKKIPQEIYELLKLEDISSFRKYLELLKSIRIDIIRALFLVFIFSFTSLSIIIALGKGKISTLELEIIKTIETVDFSNTIKFILMQAFIFGIIHYYITRKNNIEFDISDMPKNHSSKNRLIENVIAVVYLIFEYSPIIILFVTSISGFEKLFLDFHILNNEFKILQSVGNSVFISSVSSIILVILGYIFVKLKLERTALIPIYVSTAFWGISLVYLEIIFGLPEIIIAIIGFTIINLPLAYNFLASSVLNFKNEILEAARLDGASKSRIFFSIELPILKNIFFAVFFQIFAIIFGEFTFSYIINTSEFPLISVVIFRMLSKRYILESSAIGSVLLIFIIVFYFISEQLLSKEK